MPNLEKLNPAVAQLLEDSKALRDQLSAAATHAAGKPELHAAAGIRAALTNHKRTHKYLIGAADSLGLDTDEPGLEPPRDRSDPWNT